MNNKLFDAVVDSAKGNQKYNPRILTNSKGVQFVAADSTLRDDNMPLDKDWVKFAFLTSDERMSQSKKAGPDLKPLDIHNRYYSTAFRKFTDTSMGGNIGMNARPQFTPYADIRVKGRMPNRQDVTLFNMDGNFGLGRFYSEGIDDYSQTIYLQFGVPQYSSMFSFFKNAFSPYASSMANTGRPPSSWSGVGRILGEYFTFGLFPVATISIVVARAINSFIPTPTHKYYTLKETMTNYWTAVNTLVNLIAINLGIFPKVETKSGTKSVGGKPVDLRKMGVMFEPDTEYQQALRDLLPDALDKYGNFDIFALANRAQRLATRLSAGRQYSAAPDKDYIGYVVKDSGGGNDATEINQIIGDSGSDQKPGFSEGVLDWLKKTLDASITFAEYTAKSSDPSKLETQTFWNDDMTEGTPHLDKWRAFLDAEFKQGSKFAIFKVDFTGPVQESFSSTVGESEISNKYNSMSSQSRQARFSVMDGALTDGLLGDIVGGTVNAIKDLASGALEGATLGMSNGLKGLAGSGFIDIPKVWQNSSAQLPKSSYTMQLIAPYGNVISRMQNVFIPLAMIMAGTLPLSTGKASYTSPFLCTLYDRGRNQVKTGIIESLSITRGTSNLAFDKHGKIFAVDVTFSITDLSSIMHMPISPGGPWAGGIINGVANYALGQIGDVSIDADNILMDYLAVLAAQDIYSQVYAGAVMQRNMIKQKMMGQQFFNPHRWAMVVHDEMSSGVLSLFPIGIFSNSHIPLPGFMIDALNKGTDTVSNNNQ